MLFAKKNWFISMFIILILLFTGCTEANTQNNEAEYPKDISENIDKDINKVQIIDFTKEQAIEIEKEFFNRILNLEVIEATNEVVDFQSKEELIQYVFEVADKELATLFVDNTYTEKAGKLYIIPKGGPAILLPYSPYEFNKIDENTYEIVQDEEDMLRGPYRLTVEFKYLNNKWKMSNRKEESRIVEQNFTEENTTEGNISKDNNLVEGTIDPESAKAIINDIADKVIYSMSIKDAKGISEYVHPKKGVRFTPYTYVSLEDDLVFNKEEIKTIFDNKNIYTWGHYDGSGEEINLTPSEYYEAFVYSKDFLNAPEVGYNKVLSLGNMIENQFDVYDNPIVVEYYFSGFDPEYEGIDWRSLRLVFEAYENDWRLVGVINNQWTI